VKRPPIIGPEILRLENSCFSVLVILQLRCSLSPSELRISRREDDLGSVHIRAGIVGRAERVQAERAQ